MQSIIYLVIPSSKQPSLLGLHGLIKCASVQEAEELNEGIKGGILISNIYPN